MPNIHGLSNYAKLNQDINPAAVAATTTNGEALDMVGFDGVLFLLSVGAIDGLIDAKAQSDSASGFASPTDVPGAIITQIPATGDNTMRAIDVHGEIPEQFMRISVTSTGTANLICATSLRYRGRRHPTVQPAEVAQVVEVSL